MKLRQATAVVVGAGDYIGAAIARAFALEGFIVVAGRRDGGKLLPLAAEVEATGGRIITRSLDARKEDEVIDFMQLAEQTAPIEVCIFNIGANMKFPFVDTTERVFRKVWELACYSGFLSGREAARHMLKRGRGCIFFTGATASMRGGAGYAAFASAKAGLRAAAESAARELMPKGLHVSHLVIDSGVDTEWVRQQIASTGGDTDRVLMRPEAVAQAYLDLWRQPEDAWSFETQIRPKGERW